MSRVVLVCGGRDYLDTNHVEAVLNGIHLYRPITKIVQGGAMGADTLARWWARKNGVYCVTVEADWLTHGKAAGPIRNQRMLDEQKPDYVVAFPGGRGTADMVRRAHAAKVPVIDSIPPLKRSDGT